MTSKKKAQKVTLSAWVEEEFAVDFLSRFAFLFNRISHRYFVDYIIKKKDGNELKANYQKLFGINSRMFNSVDFQAKAKWLARKTQYKETIQMYENKIRSHNQWIVAKRKKIVAAKAKIQKIDDYKRRKAEYTGKGRKPIFTNALAKLDTSNLLNEINDCEKRISQKKFRINTLKGQLCRAKKRLDQSALCFGGERLFKKQHNLENTEFDSFEEWLAYFNIQRNGSSFWVGAHCETAGNLNAKYDHKAGCFWVKTPKAFEMKLDQIRVPVSFSLEQEKLLLKNQEIGRPVSVRFVKKAKRSRNGNLVKLYNKNKKFLRFETEMFC